MFITEYLEKRGGLLNKNGKKPVSFHYEVNETLLPHLLNAPDVKKKLENWLPNRPHISELYDKNILPDPLRWSKINPFLDHFLFSRINSMPLQPKTNFKTADMQNPFISVLPQNENNVERSLRPPTFSNSHITSAETSKFPQSPDTLSPSQDELNLKALVTNITKLIQNFKVDSDLENSTYQTSLIKPKGASYSQPALDYIDSLFENTYADTFDEKLSKISLIHQSDLEALETKLETKNEDPGLLLKEDIESQYFNLSQENENLIDLLKKYVLLHEKQETLRNILSISTLPNLKSEEIFKKNGNFTSQLKKENIHSTKEHINSSYNIFFKVYLKGIFIVSSTSHRTEETYNLISSLYSILEEHTTKAKEDLRSILNLLSWGQLTSLKDKGGLLTLTSKSSIEQFKQNFISLFILQKCYECLYLIESNERKTPSTPHTIYTAISKLLKYDTVLSQQITVRDCLFIFDTNVDRLWIFKELAEPILERFRFYFESENILNRLDKPEWAFHYLIDQLDEHSNFLAANWNTRDSPLASILDNSIDSFDPETFTENTYLSLISPINELAFPIRDELLIFIFQRFKAILEPSNSPYANDQLTSDKLIDPGTAYSSQSTIITTPMVPITDLKQDSSVSTHLNQTKLGTSFPLQQTKSVYPTLNYNSHSSNDMWKSIEQTFPPESLTSSLFLYTLQQLLDMQNQWSERVSVKSASLLTMFDKNWSIQLSNTNLSNDENNVGLLDIWLFLDHRIIHNSIKQLIKSDQFSKRSDAFISVDPSEILPPAFATSIIGLITSIINRIEFLTEESAYQYMIEGLVVHVLNQFRDIIRNRWNSIMRLINEQDTVSLCIDSLDYVIGFMNTELSMDYPALNQSIQSLHTTKTKMLSLLVEDYMEQIRDNFYTIQHQPFTFSELPIKYLKRLKNKIQKHVFHEFLDVLEIPLDELFLDNLNKFTLSPLSERFHMFISNCKFLFIEFNRLDSEGLNNSPRLSRLKEIIQLLTIPLKTSCLLISSANSIVKNTETKFASQSKQLYGSLLEAASNWGLSTLNLKHFDDNYTNAVDYNDSYIPPEQGYALLEQHNISTLPPTAVLYILEKRRNLALEDPTILLSELQT